MKFYGWLAIIGFIGLIIGYILGGVDTILLISFGMLLISLLSYVIFNKKGWMIGGLIGFFIPWFYLLFYKNIDDIALAILPILTFSIIGLFVGCFIGYFVSKARRKK